MWQRFSERARRVILLGQEEAGKMNSGYVGTEHLLLGLARENEGIAADVLQQMGVEREPIRAQVLAAMPAPSEQTIVEPKLTRPAKYVLELAADEARHMRHSYIGTEHLLLALLREKDGLAAKVLRELGVELESARAQVVQYLGENAELAERESNPTRRRATSPEFVEILQAAAEIRHDRNGESIEVKDLLLAICQSDSAQILREAGVDVEALRAHLER